MDQRNAEPRNAVATDDRQQWSGQRVLVGGRCGWVDGSHFTQANILFAATKKLNLTKTKCNHC